jgi:hypothetical protein
MATNKNGIKVIRWFCNFFEPIKNTKIAKIVIVGLIIDEEATITEYGSKILLGLQAENVGVRNLGSFHMKAKRGSGAKGQLR